MLLGFTSSRKLPRLFLIQGLPGNDDQFVPIKGVKVIWPESLQRHESAVLDLSLAGLAIQGSGLIAKVKMGQSFDLRLKIEGNSEDLILKSRIVRMSGKMIGVVFESISAQGRMVLDQTIKDRLIESSMQCFSTADLHPTLQAPIWLHGPFDTNVFVWNKTQDGQVGADIAQALIEYDHLVWIYNEGKVSLQKTGSAIDETRGYLTPDLMTAESAKISMGASWLDRLLKLLTAMELNQSVVQSKVDLKVLQQILRSQRNQ